MTEDDWCPKQSGTFTAYDPEYLHGEEWRLIPTQRSKSGAPYPLLNGGINSTIGLCGHEQAQAIAWLYAAKAKSEGVNIKVRVQPYKVMYNIKAKKISNEHRRVK